MSILVLWSVPRGRSTAFFRMMAERGDLTVLHEPFSHLAVFGTVDVGGRTAASAPEVIDGVRALAATRPVFVKETTDRRYPGVLADPRFLGDDATHTFLIRHPRETIRSYLAIRPDAASYEMGFAALHEMYAEVRRLTGRAPVVVDAGDLVARPADTVRAYCTRAGIAFRPDALSWRPDERPEWRGFHGWHTDVAASTGFTETPGRATADAEPHPSFDAYLADHLPYYEDLHARRLVP